MRTVLRLFACLAILAVLCRADARTQQHVGAALAITSVAIIDVSAATGEAAVKADQTVIVRAGTIAAIGNSRTTAVPADAQPIDGRGKYLIPGLWDMHAHALNAYEWAFPLFIANGVTGIREMGTVLPFERISEIRQATSKGKLLGPRLGAATAQILDGRGSVITPSTVVETGDEARRLVREYRQRGIDFIKPYNLLSRDVYLAIVDEAKRQKMSVAGHVPVSMTATEASDLGQVSIEHSWDIFLSSSSDEAKLRQDRLDLMKDSPAQVFSQIEARAAATLNEWKAGELFRRFARNGTWITPTLVVFVTATIGERDRTNDERLKYIPTTTRERWHKQWRQRPAGFAERQATLNKSRLQIVKLMHRARVSLLAGTDILNPFLFPGFSLHHELELLVQAGLSPLEALRTATLNPARFLGRDKELGTIERGKLADLVLLDADPLQDIHHTQRIAAVVTGGRLYDRASLDAMLEAAASDANR